MSPLKAMHVPILTNTQLQIFKNMLETQTEIQTVEISLDLGLSLSKIQINPIEKTILIENNTITIPKSFDETKEICYAIMDD